MPDGNGQDKEPNERFLRMNQDAWILHALVDTLKLRYKVMERMIAKADVLVPQTAWEPAGVFAATLPLLDAIEYILKPWIGEYRQFKGGLEGFVEEMTEALEAYQRFEQMLKEEAEK